MNLDDRLNMYFENDERYADLLNGSIFHGKQVVSAEDLNTLDTKSIKNNSKSRYRDNLRRVAFDTNFSVLALENQKQTDYKMPLRCMDCDIREYERQARAIERKNRRKHKASEGLADTRDHRKTEKITGAEYLSGFRKTDRLHPCATIVLFFGEEWDGSVSLHQMMDFSDIPKEVRSLVQDYRIKLVHIRQLDNLNDYKSDLRQVFEVVKYAEDREKMKEILTRDEAYQRMEEDTAELVAELVHVPQVLKYREQEGEGDKVNMCRAWREMMEESREEGIKEGIKEGEEKGKELSLEMAVRKLMKNLDRTAESVMELLEIPMEERERYLKKF